MELKNIVFLVFILLSFVIAVISVGAIIQSQKRTDESIQYFKEYGCWPRIEPGIFEAIANKICGVKSHTEGLSYCDEGVSFYKFEHSPSISEFAVIRSLSYQYLIGYLKDKKFPVTLTITADDTGDKRVMTINSISEVPKESVPTECPHSNKYHFGKCWFIKYDER